MKILKALSTHHELHMRRIVICVGCTTFSHNISKRHDFRKRKVTEHKMCFDFLYNYGLKHFSI